MEAEIQRLEDAVKAQEATVNTLSHLAEDIGLQTYFPDLVVDRREQNTMLPPHLPGQLVRDDIVKEDFELVANM